MIQEELDDEIISELEDFYYSSGDKDGEYEARLHQSHQKIILAKIRSLSEENNKRA